MSSQETITVHTWDAAYFKHTSPGHAAIQIGLGTTPDKGYVSLHPSNLGIGKGRKLKRLSQDVTAYKTTKQRHRKVVIAGFLDMQAMRKYWNDFKSGTVPYSTKDFCSSLVHDILVAGGGDNYAKGWGSWALFAWSPSDVHDYANAILQGISKQK